MNSISPFKILISLTFIVSMTSFATPEDTPFLIIPPKADQQEALIQHWSNPEQGLSFRDIPELPKPYMSTIPIDKSDGIPVAKLSNHGGNVTMLSQIVNEVVKGEHGTLDSLLIAKNGHLVFESYYKRGRLNLSHPQSSATKSYTSFALGRAIQLGYLSMADLDKPVINFLKDLNRQKLVPGAEKITLHHALTMTTGIDISEQQWKAINEQPEQLQGQQEIQVLLETSAPITAESQVFKYGIGPQFIMQVIEAVVPGSAEKFIKTELLDKLGITNYSWKTAPSGLPESGWKSSFTSRDMLKFGLLANNDGKWQGEQLISEEYINKATSRIVYNGDDDIYGGGKDVSNQGYGYYFWGTDLQVGEQQFSSASAQGGGGMYIMLIDALDLVVVVTAHHRDDKTQQFIAEKVIPVFL